MTHEEAVAAAVRETATNLLPDKPDGSFRERTLEKHLLEALRRLYPPASVRPRWNLKKVGLALPDWNPQPGPIDVAIVDGEQPVVTLELKVQHVDQALWDIYKMESARGLSSVQAAFVIVAAKTARWSGAGDCIRLFTPLEDEPEDEEWYSEFLFHKYPKAWIDLLRGGSARPVRVPEVIRLLNLCSAQVAHSPGYEIRAIRVEGVDDGRWLEFGADGWPNPATVAEEGWPRRIADDDLTTSDLPAENASEDALHTFALSIDGYKRMGSLSELQRFGNAALQRWRASGELPVTLSELRCCLFCEQRRWHHFGESFDDETMRYVRDVVAAIRPLIADHDLKASQAVTKPAPDVGIAREERFVWGLDEVRLMSEEEVTAIVSDEHLNAQPEIATIEQARRLATETSLSIEERRQRINQIAGAERVRLGVHSVPAIECYLEQLARSESAGLDFLSFGEMLDKPLFDNDQ